MTKNIRFSRHNQPVACRVCKKTTLSHNPSTGGDICQTCWDAAGLENEHSDYGHPTAVAGCPTCDADALRRGETTLRAMRATAATAPSARCTCGTPVYGEIGDGRDCPSCPEVIYPS